MNNRDMPLSRQSEPEHNSSTMIIEDLLGSISEWRSVPDIIRLSMRALTDSLRLQGNQLKDIQYLQNESALKSELTLGLAMKANLSDLSRAIAETRASLDNKASYEEVRAFMDDRVTKNDLLHLLQGKVSVEEFRTTIEFKADVKEMQDEIRGLRMIIEDLKAQFGNSLQQCTTQREMQALQRVLETKADLAEVNAALNEKATKTSVANALHKKANKADVDEMLAEKVNANVITSLTAAIESKVGISSFNMLAAEVDKKADTSSLEKSISLELAQKADQRDLENLYNSLSSLRKELEIKHQQQAIQFGNYISDLKTEGEMSKLTLSQAIEKKADFKEFEKLSDLVHKKSDSEEMNYLHSSLKNECAGFIQSQQLSLKQDLKRIEGSLNEQFQSLETKIRAFESDQGSFKEILRSTSEKQKQDLAEFAKYSEKAKNEEVRTIRYDLEKIQRELEESKSIRSEELRRSDMKALKENVELKLDEIDWKLKEVTLKTKEIIDKNDRELVNFSESIKEKNQSIEALKGCVDEFRSNTLRRQDWETQAMILREEIEKLGKELLLKANIKDICTLLDIKANIDDVNRALEDIHSEIDQKINVDELAEKLKEQSCINEALCAENCVGRWLWKGAELKGGNIPWEIQTINTCPENFVWEKDKTTVLTLSPGLYQVIFGVFAKKKVSVQLMVNGEVVVSEGGSAGKAIGKHSSGNVVGCTCSEYLSLPARARISLSLSGDPSEGFLGLWKL